MHRIMTKRKQRFRRWSTSTQDKKGVTSSGADVHNLDSTCVTKGENVGVPRL